MAKEWQKILDDFSSGTSSTSQTTSSSAQESTTKNTSSNNWQGILDSFSGSSRNNYGGTIKSASKRKQYDSVIAPVASRVITIAQKKKKEEEEKKKEEEEKKKEEEEKKKKKWYEKGHFEDGYDFGDVTKTILGVKEDTASLWDLTVGSLKRGYYNSLYGEETFKEMGGQKNQKDVYEQILAGDEYQFTPGNDAAGAISGAAELLGQQFRQFTNPRTLALAGTAAGAAAVAGQAGPQVLVPEEIISVPAAAMAGFTTGSSMSNLEIEAGHAYNEMIDAGISEETARKVAMGVGAVNAGLELVQVDELLDAYKVTKASGATKTFTKKILDELLERGVDVGKETLQEVAQERVTIAGVQFASEMEKGEKAYSADEVTDRLLDTAKSSALSFGAMNVPAAAKNTVSIVSEQQKANSLTQNEQAVVDKVAADRIAEKEKDGTKLTNKEKAAIEEQVVKDMERGYIPTDTIEEVLGGDSYSSYKETVDREDAILKEYEELGEKPNATPKDYARYTELTQQVKDIHSNSQREALRAKLDEDVMGIVQGSRLAESYNERTRRSQKFEADVTKYDTKQQAVIQKAIDSGILNNTNRTHEFVDIISKISADKGVLFDFTNNKKLKESGFAVDGRQVNGFVTKDGISLNIDSPQAWQKTVGHEVTHVLEGTEFYTELQKTLFDYAESKGELGSRIDTLKELYKDVQDADINAELTADLVGEYLFTDESFIKNLSTEHRNVFQKIYDEIKYLYKVATGSKEAKELEKVKRAFEKAYKEGGNTKTNERSYAKPYTKAQPATNTQPVAKTQDNTQTVVPAKTQTIRQTVEQEYAAKENIAPVAEPKKVDAIVPDTKPVVHRQTVLNVGKQNHTVAEASQANVQQTTKREVVNSVPASVKKSEQQTKAKPVKDVYYNFISIAPNQSFFSNERNGQSDECHYTLYNDNSADLDLKPFSGGIHQGGRIFNLFGPNYDFVIDGQKIDPDASQNFSHNYYTFEDVVRPVLRQINGGDYVPHKKGVMHLYSDLRDVPSQKINMPIQQETVQYSLSDSDGKQLTKEQQDYFKDSKMRDENGNLKVMYHGSQDAGFHVFDPGYSDDGTSLFFVDRSNVAASYSGSDEIYEARTINTVEDLEKFFAEIGAEGYEVVEENGRLSLYHEGDHVVETDDARGIYEEFCDYAGVGEGEANYKVYLNLKNPLEVDAQGRSWNNVSREYSQEVADRYRSLTAAEKAALTDAAEWGEISIFRDAKNNPPDDVTESAFAKMGDVNIYDLFTIAEDNFSEETIKQFAVKQMNTRDYAKKAKAEGYDGVIFKNIEDIGGYGVRGETVATVAIAFDSNQIKSVANAKPTADPDIRYSLDANTPINEVTDNGLTMTYVRVPNQNTPYYGSTYGQDIEPAGEYMSMDTMQGKNKIDGYEYGTIQFKKPLVLEHINTGATGWKKTVSDMYGGLTGKKLTKALIKDGYDAIVTYDDYGYSEIVNLNGKKLNNGDARHSLSNNGEQFGKTGQFATPATELRYEAPVAEKSSVSAPVAENATTTPTVAENATVQPETQLTGENSTVTADDMSALFPNNAVPVQEELDQLISERDELYGALEIAVDRGSAAEVGKLAEEYEALNSRIKELESTERERTGSITDVDAPAEMDAPLSMKSENYDPYNGVTLDDINRNYRTYSDRNPGARQFIEEAALGFAYDVYNSTQGERWYNDELHYATGGEKGFGGTKRSTTDDIADLKDYYGYTWEQLRKAADDVVKGEVRSVAAKRVEYLIHKRLMEGYTDVDGRRYEPNQEYITFLNEQFANEQRAVGFDSLLADADHYAPIAEDIAPTLEKATPDTMDAPIFESKDKNAVKGQTTMFEPEKPKVNPRVATVLTEESHPREKTEIGMKAVSAFVDKGMVFENLSLDTGNHEVQAKWNSALPSNTEKKAQYFMENGADGVKPLKEIIKDVKKTGKEEAFSDYMYHVHNIDRMSLEERFGLENKAVFGDTITAEVSRKKVQQYEKANPEFKAIAESVYAYNKHLRGLLVENGVISQETADLWEKEYPHYVPVRRVDQDGKNIIVPLDTNKTGVNAPVKRATGGNSNIEPLFNTMAMRTEQVFSAIARNSFGIELKNTLDSTITRQKNATGVDEAINLIEDQESSLLKPGTLHSNPTFTVFENGERVEFEITEDMYDALKPAGKLLGHRNEKITKVSNWRRNLLTTWNPVFALWRNPVKDLQDVMINSQHAAKTYAQLVMPTKDNVIYQIATHGKWAAEYESNGGKGSTYFDSNNKKFREEDNIFKKTIGFPVRAIEWAGEFIEEIPRLAEYIASRKEGRSVDRSMLDAARVTTNFAAGGDVTKFANAHGFTFLNASVQGASQHVRNFREATRQDGMKGFVKTLAKYTLAGIPGIILNNLIWDDDEEYEELSDYVKQNYYVVWKTQDGKFFRIPKGRTAAVMNNALEQIQHLVTGDDEADFSTFFELFMNNIAPNNPIDNNILAPIGQALNNKAWYGDDLVPTRLQDLPAEEQFDESTDALSKIIGEKTGTSPYKWNYLIDQYSGGLGDMLLPMATPEAESGDNSFVGNLLAPWKKEMTTDSVLNNKNPGNFYDLKDELEVVANGKNATEEDKMKSMYLDSVSWEMGDLYAQKREIQSSDLPDDQKYAKVREIQEQINELANNALDKYEHVRINGAYSEAGDRRYNYDADKDKWYEIKPTNSDGSDNWYYIQEQLSHDKLGMSYDDFWNGKQPPEGGTYYGEYNGKRYNYDAGKSQWYEIRAKNDDGSDNWYYQKEQEVTKGLGISYEEYWSNREEYNFAYDKPGQYAISQAVGGYDSYMEHYDALHDWQSDNYISADKDDKGNSISGSRKKKVSKYIDGLDLDYGEKIIMYRSVYSSKADKRAYNQDIIDYLNSRDDIDYQQMKAILEELDMEVDSEGYIKW